MPSAPVLTSFFPTAPASPATSTLSLHDALPISADTMLTVLPRPDRPSAGAAKRAKGAGPQPGGGPSLVMVQTSGEVGRAPDWTSFTSPPPMPTCTGITQTREPAAGCCPLMVAVP